MIRHRRSPLVTALRWFAVLGWAGAMWGVLSLPGEDTPDISFIPFGDKLAHAALFCIWGFLICWAADKSLRALSRIGVGIMSVLAAALFGIVVEVYQATIGRDADVVDGLADVAGAMVACYLYFSPTWKKWLTKLIARPAKPAARVSLQIQSSPAKPNLEAGIEQGKEQKGEE